MWLSGSVSEARCFVFKGFSGGSSFTASPSLLQQRPLFWVLFLSGPCFCRLSLQTTQLIYSETTTPYPYYCNLFFFVVNIYVFRDIPTQTDKALASSHTNTHTHTHW